MIRTCSNDYVFIDVDAGVEVDIFVDIGTFVDIIIDTKCIMCTVGDGNKNNV